MSQGHSYDQDRISELEWRVEELLEHVCCLENDVDRLTRELTEAKGELAKRMALDSENEANQQTP